MTKVINGGPSAARNKHRAYIGRGTVFGNPFRIGVDGTREEVIAKYAAWFNNNEALKRQVRDYLTGKTLVCHCKPLACHGDVIANYLDQQSQDENLF